MALLHPMHLAIVMVVMLLVFGPRKLPELAKGIGEAMKELKQTLHADSAAEEQGLNPLPTANEPTTHFVGTRAG